MSTHGPSHAPAGIPLQALVAELRSRGEAISRLQGGATYFHEELGIFRHVAAEQSLFFQAPPDELSRTPDEEGNEHQAWYARRENFSTAIRRAIDSCKTTGYDPDYQFRDVTKLITFGKGGATPHRGLRALLLPDRPEW